MDEIREKFVEGYNNHKPQLLKKILVADVETPISSLLKINKDQKYSFLFVIWH